MIYKKANIPQLPMLPEWTPRWQPQTCTEVQRGTCASRAMPLLSILVHAWSWSMSSFNFSLIEPHPTGLLCQQLQNVYQWVVERGWSLKFKHICPWWSFCIGPAHSWVCRFETIYVVTVYVCGLSWYISIWSWAVMMMSVCMQVSM